MIEEKVHEFLKKPLNVSAPAKLLPKENEEGINAQEKVHWYRETEKKSISQTSAT